MLRFSIIFLFLTILLLPSYSAEVQKRNTEKTPSVKDTGSALLEKGYKIWFSENYNKYPQAAELFRKAIKKDPNNPEYYSALGRILFEMGENDKSFKELNKALYLKPQKAWILAWTYICLGEIYEKKGDYKIAVKNFDSALKVNTTLNSNQEAFMRKTLAEWQHRESKHFIFAYPEGGFAERDIDSIVENYESEYDSISSFIGVKLDSKIQCYLFASRKKGVEITGLEPDFVRPNVKQIYTLYGTDKEENPFPGRLITMVLSFYIGKTVNREPFFRWGLAEFLSRDASDFKTLIKELKASEEFIPLSSLKKGFYNYSQKSAYIESGSFVGFLITKYGIGKFKKIWIREDVDKAIKNVYGKSFLELEKEWNKYYM